LLALATSLFPWSRLPFRSAFNLLTMTSAG
jgi:hypothetical protein